MGQETKPKCAPDKRFSRIQQDHLSVIDKRIEWLAQRQSHDSSRSATLTAWIRREIAALTWVKQVIQDSNHENSLIDILEDLR